VLQLECGVRKKIRLGEGGGERVGRMGNRKEVKVEKKEGKNFCHGATPKNKTQTPEKRGRKEDFALRYLGEGQTQKTPKKEG